MTLLRLLLPALGAFLLLVGAAFAEPALYAVSDDDTTVYVSGSAHLPGDEGLLNLLRGEGCAVARQ